MLLVRWNRSFGFLVPADASGGLRVRSQLRVALVLVLSVLACGCNYTWRAKTVQPPLRLDLGTEARTSLRGTILMGDHDLPKITGLDGVRRRFKLANSAYFVVVNRDRLRFKVSLVHKWEQIADPARWLVYLEDNHGNRYHAVGVESRVLRPITKHFQVGEFLGAGTHSYPLLSVHVYNGTGDYVFHETDIFSDAVGSLTLVMQRPGYEYRYSWQFTDDPQSDQPIDQPSIGGSSITTESNVAAR